MLGRILSCRGFLISECTDGGPNTIHTHCSFSPDVDYLNKRIEEAEDRGLYFLGEWHSHPGSLRLPTAGDIKTISDVMLDNSLSSFIALIFRRERDSDPSCSAYLFEDNNMYKEIEYKINDEEEIGEMLPWFMTENGKRRLILESKLMRNKFPGFSLRRKNDVLFWMGSYKEHEIVLTYPSDYPTTPLNIRVTPEIPSLPDEVPCFYSVLAVQIAHIRIESKTNQYTTNARTEPSRERLLEASLKWYQTEEGKKILRRQSEKLKELVQQVQVLRLKDGKLTFKCTLDEVQRSYVLIICPENYPDATPDVHIFCDGKEIEVQLSAIERWKNTPSLLNIIDEASRVVREYGVQ